MQTCSFVSIAVSSSHDLVYELAHEIALSSDEDLGVSAHLGGPTIVYAALILKYG